MDDARAEWAEVARGIGRFEPVTVVVDPAQEAEARRLLGPDVDVLVMPLDDSVELRNGPIFVRDGDGSVAAVQFRFDGWNEQFTRYDKDAEVPADSRGLGSAAVPGAVHARGRRLQHRRRGHAAHDGAVPAAQPQPRLQSRRQRGAPERLARRGQGDRLPYGLVEDSGPFSTSGHVDDVAQFIAPGVVVAQTAPAGNANHTRLQENLEVLKAATDAAGRRLEVIELELLPYVQGVGAGLDGVTGPAQASSCRRPTSTWSSWRAPCCCRHRGRGRGRGLRATRRARRPRARRPAVRAPAFGGGGLGCITQQVPAGTFATRQE